MPLSYVFISHTNSPSSVTNYISQSISYKHDLDTGLCITTALHSQGSIPLWTLVMLLHGGDLGHILDIPDTNLAANIHPSAKNTQKQV